MEKRERKKEQKKERMQKKKKRVGRDRGEIAKTGRREQEICKTRDCSRLSAGEQVQESKCNRESATERM